MMHLPILLYWLAGYSTAQLMMLIAGPLMILGAAAMLIQALNGKNFSVWASIAGLLSGFCWTAGNLLRKQPQWDDLVIALSILGVLAQVCYFVLFICHQKAKRANILSMQPVVPSDKIWPPPPTAGD